MEIGDVIEFIKTKNPELIRKTSFTSPQYRQYRCTRWVLILGPTYGDAEYRGSLIVDAVQLLVWASHHAEACWSSDEADQQARVFLPGWLREADLDDESVTLLGKELHRVVGQYDQNFLAFSHTRTYCPECNALHTEVVVAKQNGRGTRILVQDWSCPLGHRVYYEETQIII